MLTHALILLEFLLPDRANPCLICEQPHVIASPLRKIARLMFFSELHAAQKQIHDGLPSVLQDQDAALLPVRIAVLISRFSSPLFQYYPAFIRKDRQ